jgi:hypothetical protein
MTRSLGQAPLARETREEDGTDVPPGPRERLPA